MSDHPLWHQSGVNRNGEPFVQLILGVNVIAQMDLNQAREHALAMLEAAESAEQDAFLVSWVREHMGSEEHVAAGLLREFRAFRRAKTGKISGQEVRPSDNSPAAGSEPIG